MLANRAMQQSRPLWYSSHFSCGHCIGLGTSSHVMVVCEWLLSEHLQIDENFSGDIDICHLLSAISMEEDKVSPVA